ncbi:serine hydrolase domain-containing protein [Hymenobacter sp. HDW8]|uniref:serine hydrolase domain-containing protein n=1 Tax=Hymenobacter sp. HDW8 TaxID=2714932 RepID=UPI00140E6A7C|nr:serine hydrolase domain-containing protein [Hymenobacter sp. HDW8]QIL76317.1 beta-lactamase family protein [Hymenobacter sp. HDW8]
MKKLYTLVLLLLSLQAGAQTGVPVPELAHFDTAIEQFVQRWEVLGASVALSRSDKLVYARAFGYADQARTTPLQPHHLMRVASLSKPITAMAVMKLVEEGRLDLAHKAFGPEGYLSDAYYTEVIDDRRIYDITVQQLLEHSAGWDREKSCDGFASCDPIDFPEHVAQVMNVPNPVGDSTLVRFMLSKGLNFRPGARFAYSNIGYLVLGKIIEAVTLQPYEAWVRDHLLLPSGVREAHLGRNLLVDKQEREAEYDSHFQQSSCYGTGEVVPAAYGGCNVEAMNAHGGWIFTARDLTRLLTAVDGAKGRPGLLSTATIATMVEPSAVNARYAKGWQVNTGNRWHSGCLDGTATYLVRAAKGYTWTILLNTRRDDAAFWTELDRLGWACIRGATEWPAHNLVVPDQNAAQLTGTSLTKTSTLLKWANGTGNRRIVLMKADSPVDDIPLDGVDYVANPRFGKGQALAGGSFVVANGEADTVMVKNLDPNRAYFVRVVEYAKSETTSQQALYALEANATMILNEHLAEPSLVAAQPALQMDPGSAYSELALQLVPASLSSDAHFLPNGILPPSSATPALEPVGNQPSRIRESGRAVLRLFTK